MQAIPESRIWDIEDPISSIMDGQVVDAYGGAVRLRTIIQRRWGWPKAAADVAAEWLRKAAAQAGREPATLWLTNPARDGQQRMLMAQAPNLLTLLLSGLARGSSRERHDTGLPLRSVSVCFDGTITDEGFTRALIDVVAIRLGITTHDLRERLTFTAQDNDGLCLDVVLADLDMGASL